MHNMQSHAESLAKNLAMRCKIICRSLQPVVNMYRLHLAGELHGAQ